MRISDWSSDVCSSDLLLFSRGGTDDGIRATLARADRSERGDVFGLDRECVSLLRFIAPDFHRRQRRISGLHVAQLEVAAATVGIDQFRRSEEHTSELQSLMRISYAVFCLKKKNTPHNTPHH